LLLGSSVWGGGSTSWVPRACSRAGSSSCWSRCRSVENLLEVGFGELILRRRECGFGLFESFSFHWDRLFDLWGWLDNFRLLWFNLNCLFFDWLDFRLDFRSSIALLEEYADSGEEN
jgi:hypothetical protein